MDTPRTLSERDDSAYGMVNENYSPTEKEEDVLDVLREENRANPYLLRDETGLGKGDVNTALSNLRAAGWVVRVTRGLYEFVEDPRREGSRDNTTQATESGDETSKTAVSAISRERVAGLEYDRELTDARLDLLVEFLTWMQERGQKARKGEAKSGFWKDRYEDTTGYGFDSFWEAFAKQAMKQLPGFTKPDSFSYYYAGENNE